MSPGMIAPELVYVVLALLALSIALNFKLTFIALASIKKLQDAAAGSRVLPVGISLPDLTGKRLQDGQAQAFIHCQQAVVLLFLASACPKCQQKLAEIEALRSAAQHAGVQLFLLSIEPRWRIRRFLRATSLAEITILTSKADYTLLNPTLSSPHYLFINHAATLEAHGAIGDENWRSFCGQLGLSTAP